MKIILTDTQMESLKYAVAFTFHALTMTNSEIGLDNEQVISDLHEFWHVAGDVEAVEVTLHEPSIDEQVEDFAAQMGGDDDPREMAFDEFVKSIASSMGIRIITPRGIFLPEEQ